MYPPSSGVSAPDWLKPKRPISLFGDPSTFTAALNTQASDYDEIMKQYANFTRGLSGNSSILGSIKFNPIYGGSPLSYNPINSPKTLTSSPLSSSNPLTYDPIKFSPITGSRNIDYNPITATTSPYTQSGDVTKSLANLEELSRTGGYSSSDIQNIRERNVSPIRSIYASGQQGLERQRALSGGYSPNFNAVSAKMAREQADKIGDIVTKTNADIAQNVATNKLSASGTYGGLSAQANAARTAADQRNADIINEINQANAARKTDVEKFNLNTGLNIDEFNKQIQMAIDEANKNNKYRTDVYNRDREFDINKLNRNTQLELDKENRDTNLGIDKYNRENQLNVDKSNRDTQIGIDSANREAKFNTDRFNIDNLFKNNQSTIQNILEALRGRASLYGTTPALANLFGNQVLQAGNLGQNQQELNNRRLFGLIGRG